MQLVDGNGKPTSTKEMLKEKTYRPGDIRDHQYKPEKVNTDDTQSGVYSIVYIVYAPELPNNNAEIRVTFPNKKEYKRVRRQMFFGKRYLKFKNEFGQIQTVNLNNPYLVSATLERFELAKDSKIVLPSKDFVKAN